ncbi:MAG: hypothetical protein GVY18_16695 [Bacteroidetes bacterium]|jgi:hypothetical protein|nr:hypothetical protein [Bacteroidota bacterium]
MGRFPVNVLRRAWRHVRFRWMLRRYPPAVVLQMGKVGSTALYRALRQAYPGVVVHAHNLRPKYPSWKVRALYRHGIVQERSMNVISLTRKPVVRNISAFFENFERFTGEPFEAGRFTTEELGRRFMEHYRHEEPLVWFDDVIKHRLGIDVYAEPFPDDGVATYRRENVALLVMRSELPNAVKAEAVARFLGLSPLALHEVNRSVDKPYAEAYRQFKKRMPIPTWYQDRMHRSRYYQHFYGEAATGEVVENTHEDHRREGAW